MENVKVIVTTIMIVKAVFDVPEDRVDQIVLMQQYLDAAARVEAEMCIKKIYASNLFQVG